MTKLNFVPALLLAAALGAGATSGALASAPAGNVAAIKGTAQELMPFSQLLPLIGTTADNYVQKLGDASSVRVFDLRNLLSPADVSQVGTAETSHMASLSSFRAALKEDPDLAKWLNTHDASVDNIVGMSEVGSQISIYLF